MNWSRMTSSENTKEVVEISTRANPRPCGATRVLHTAHRARKERRRGDAALSQVATCMVTSQVTPPRPTLAGSRQLIPDRITMELTGHHAEGTSATLIMAGYGAATRALAAVVAEP